MDKYDELLESERNYEEEDYFYQLEVQDGVETKEKQIAHSWKRKKEEEISRKVLDLKNSRLKSISH